MRNLLILLSRSVFLAFVLLPNVPLLFAQDTSPRSRQLQQLEPVKTWPAKAKRWAVVIGVDKYADTQITTLGGSSNDAKTLADALIKYAGFPTDQVFLLASDQPAERQPTRGNILRRLSNLAASVPSDGLLLVSFAGHGMERANQAFLLPSDAQVSNDVNLLELTAINVAQMKDFIRKTGVKQVVLVLDACRNDPVGRATADNPLTSAYVRGFNFDVRNQEVTAFATLYATAVGQRAYEYKEKQQGYFTWELVEGLKGGAANERGEVTLEGLLRYVQENVPKHVLADLGAGKDQKPFAEIGGYRADQLIIAVVASTNALPTTNTGGGLPNVTRVDPAAFEISYWDTIKSSTDPEDFKSYLRKYPDGQFADLARRRVETFGNVKRDPPSNPSDLGARTESHTQLGVFVKDDMVVERLAPGGPAELAGIRAGDKLIALNGEVLSSSLMLVNTVGRYRPGDVVEIRLERSGQSVNIRATLDATTEPSTITLAPGKSSISLADVFALGVNLGLAEVSSYQNALTTSVQNYLVGAQTVAARNGLSTLAIDNVLSQLRAGATTASQYQSVLAARQGFEQLLNRTCNCGSSVNLLNLLTLGGQVGFLEVISFQNGDPKQMAPILSSSVQYAISVGYPDTEFSDLLQKVQSGKRGKDIYSRILDLNNKIVQSMLRVCSC